MTHPTSVTEASKSAEMVGRIEAIGPIAQLAIR
jgi:hypothetical protein